MTSVPPPSPPPGSLQSRPELPDGAALGEQPDGAEAERREGLAAVPAWAPLAAMVVAFVVATIGYLLIGAGLEAAGTNVSASGPPGLVISATLLQDVVLIGSAVLFARFWATGLTAASFGLRTTRLWPAVGWMAAVLAAFWILTLLYLSLVGEPQDQSLTRDLKDEGSLVTLIAYGGLLAVVAPLAEEFFFRGFMFSVLASKWGPWAGGLATGLVFGAVHVAGSPVKTVVVLVILGVGLCFLFWRTGSLLPCVAVHALNNSISFAATKSLPPLGFAGVVLGAVAASMGIAALVLRRAPPRLS